MRREQLRTLVLIDKNGESRSFTFHRLWREDAKDQLIIELMSGHEIHQFAVTHMGEGMTDLIDGRGENYRVLGLSYQVSTASDTVAVKFQIADSYQKALAINKFLSCDASSLY